MLNLVALKINPNRPKEIVQDIKKRFNIVNVYKNLGDYQDRIETLEQELE